MKLVAAAVAGALLCCSQTPANKAVRKPGAQGPSTRQLLDIVLGSRDVPRSVDESCATVGSQPGDRTLGNYIATLLTDFASAEGRNWITASCKPAPPEDKASVWHCDVRFHREHGEDSWVRGLFFRLSRNGNVIPRSYMCTGGG